MWGSRHELDRNDRSEMVDQSVTASTVAVLLCVGRLDRLKVTVKEVGEKQETMVSKSHFLTYSAGTSLCNGGYVPCKGSMLDCHHT